MEKPAEPQKNKPLRPTLQITGGGFEEYGELEKANHDQLKKRLDALATTAASLGIDGLNYAISRTEQIGRDLTRIQRGKDLQAKPPTGYGTVAECVVMLRISERTIRRWIADADLVPVRIGDRVFVEFEKARKLKSITTGTE